MEIYMTLPQDLSDLTKEQGENIVKYLCENNDINGLRKRQELTEKQIKVVFNKEDERSIRALNNLRIMEKHLQEAILIKSQH